MVFKRLRKVFDLHRCFLYISRGLDNLVRQKWILCFAVFDLLVSLTVGSILIAKPDITMLGWMVHRLKWYIWIFVLRSLNTLLGIYGVWYRKVKTSRFYVAFLIWSILMTSFVLVPLVNTRCTCASYLQCEVLKSFLPPSRQKDIINPHPQPDDPRYTNRKVFYSLPPMPHFEVEQVCGSTLACSLQVQKREGEGAASGVVESSPSPPPNGLHPAGSANSLLQAIDVDVHGHAIRSKTKKAEEAASQEAARSLGSIARHRGGSVGAIDVAVGHQHTSPRSSVAKVADADAAWSEDEELDTGDVQDSLEQAMQKNATLKKEVEKMIEESGAEEPQDSNEAQEESKDSNDTQETKPPGGPRRLKSFVSKMMSAQRDFKQVDNVRELVRRARLLEEKNKAKLNSSEEEDDLEHHQEVIANLAERFMVSRPGIRWESEAPHCPKQEISADEVSHVKLSLGGILRGADLRRIRWSHLQGLARYLKRCLSYNYCGAVSARLFRENETAPWHYTVCKYKRPMFPVPMLYPPDISPDNLPKGRENYEVFFQRKANTEARDFQQLSGAKQTGDTEVFALEFKSLTREKALGKVSGRYKRSCRCRRHTDDSDKGCQVYQDGKHTRYWCWICRDCQQHCLDSGKQWSYGLCNAGPRGCRCAHKGLPPSKQENHTVNRSKSMGLWPGNEMNYGATCKKWRTTDERPWCYTGLDSTCSDREREHRDDGDLVTQDGKPLNIAYWRSSLACPEVGSAQWKELHAFTDKCQVIIWSTFSLLLILQLATIPATVIIYKFVANRCGDTFAVEHQFDVDMVSSDSSSDDEPALQDRRGSAADQ
eukprot:gnl/TRDRNA2_/TRDRNA2_85381_c0_seq1.p1 gnl/TRDRNA2_/TRDRNA2_85381_c0~~gnl/TRDRNA2_/TRDRNA2_85381_c0_seq1.p1  ORF type:complete len:824 (+),score=106.99 gnl/TRDRNA2_/TRDRNA2_85381_c0_seq1:112-2583(+)